MTMGTGHSAARNCSPSSASTKTAAEITRRTRPMHFATHAATHAATSQTRLHTNRTRRMLERDTAVRTRYCSYRGGRVPLSADLGAKITAVLQ